MYSSLNYKDGLAITRRGKVIRKFPMVLGVDLAGKVLESNTGEFKAGDEVLVTGQGLGETIWGGYSQLARDRLKVGGHAAERNRGYHRRNTSWSSLLSTFVRVYSNRCAPQGVHCICCFFTMRLLIIWFTVDSTKPVLIVSPFR